MQPRPAGTVKQGTKDQFTGKRDRKWEREPKRNRYLMVKSKWKLFFLFRKQPKKKDKRVIILTTKRCICLDSANGDTISVLFLTIPSLSCCQWQRPPFLKEGTQETTAHAALESLFLWLTLMGYWPESRSYFKADTQKYWEIAGYARVWLWVSAISLPNNLLT